MKKRVISTYEDGLWCNLSALQKSDIKLLERIHGYNVGDLMVGVHPFPLI